MKKQCFSCQKNAPRNDIQRLEYYQKRYNENGEVFYFYKENENDKLRIADANSFKNILPELKTIPTAEWAHIADFRIN